MEEVVRPLNDISEELKVLLSLEEQIDLVNRLNKSFPIANRLIKLNEYQIVNLYHALKASGYDLVTSEDISNNPLSVLNSGDWLAEVHNILKELNPVHTPNRTAIEYIQQAKQIKKGA